MIHTYALGENLNKKFVDIKGKILFSMFLIALLLISTIRVDVVAASPATYFFVDPPEVRDVTSPNEFLINISVTDAPDSFGWEISLSWDPALLELVTVDEGDFLHRWDVDPFTGDLVPKYETLFAYSSLYDANLEGEVLVTASLKYAVTPWASGDGWLCTLGFRVEAVGSSVLNLFDTWLGDYMLMGSPHPTYYPNQDGFFSNTLFHNIAVTDVTRARAAELVTINVTVTNEGNYTETSATFNVSVYADVTVYEPTYDPTLVKIIKNTTVVGDEIVVGTKTIPAPLAIGATTTLTFTWDTTGITGGDYTISAEVKGDDDTRDNLFIGGAVEILAHNIAITNVVPSPTSVAVGENVTITVTVENEGNFDETFNVTVYYDDTAIGMQPVPNLLSGSTMNLTFTWDTTPVAKGTYTIKAVASVVPEEINTDDNTFTFDGTVKVGVEAPNVLLYAAVGIVIVAIIAAGIAVYIIKFRKPA